MDTINLTNKRVLITGGNGYLGSFLKKELLKYTTDIYILSNSGVATERDFIVDITDAKALQEIISSIQPDVVYHLAALIDRNRDFSIYPEMYRVNVEGTSNLINALQLTQCQHIIFTSSSEVYGNNSSPFHENLLPKPVSPYSLSKAMAELLLQTRLNNTKLNYTIARIFNFYGPGMSENFFINEMVNTLKKGTDFKMTLGEQYRDFLYVDDVVSALVQIGGNENVYGEMLNVCSGEGTKIKDIALEVQKYFEAKVLLGALPYRENEVWEMIGDATKLNKIVTFTPKIALSEGIKTLMSRI